MDADLEDLDDAESQLKRKKPKYTTWCLWMGPSMVTEAKLDKYVQEGLLSAAERSRCRVPEGEKTPRPRP